MKRGPDLSAEVRQTLASLFDRARDASGDAAAPQAGAPDADIGAQARTVAALRRLPSRFRKILLLREVERLPMEEVARRLRLSRDAAERRWARAIVLLTERLAKMERRGGGKARR
jgi:DNA-directed RNA polymerase specialized sigma24 family protein